MLGLTEKEREELARVTKESMYQCLKWNPGVQEEKSFMISHIQDLQHKKGKENGPGKRTDRVTKYNMSRKQLVVKYPTGDKNGVN